MITDLSDGAVQLIRDWNKDMLERLERNEFLFGYSDDQLRRLKLHKEIDAAIGGNDGGEEPAVSSERLPDHQGTGDVRLHGGGDGVHGSGDLAAQRQPSDSTEGALPRASTRAQG